MHSLEKDSTMELTGLRVITCNNLSIILHTSKIHHSLILLLVEVVMCSSRKYPYPPHGRSMEILRGWGVSKPKFEKESTGLNWNFQRDDSNQKKTFHGRGMDILWNNTIKPHPKCPQIWKEANPARRWKGAGAKAQRRAIVVLRRVRQQI